MTLTSSGQISISDINGEFGRSGTTANSSLEDLSDGTVATINTNNASSDRPDGSAPHAMTEFYSYNHSAVGATSFGTWSDTTIRFVGLSPGGNIANHALTTNTGTFSGAMSVTASVTSGVAKGSPRVALGTSDPGTNSSNTVFDSKMKTLNGNQHGSIDFTGSNVTCNARFCFLPHSDVTESVMRDITFTNNSVTNTTMTMQTSVTNFGQGLCIHEAVPVNCKDYYKHISELEVGDMVMSYNFETNSIEEVEILRIEKPKHSDLVVYYFEDMEDITYTHGNTSTLNRGLSITKDHPIYKIDGTMVCMNPEKAKELYGLDAEEIKKGDEIRFMDKTRKIEAYLVSPDETETYTILTKNNNFYAGGVLVHSEIGE
tara:strand:- start:22 stop:1140 length:1119 start_codon:yes stop_codon:yes gene_type:complete